MAEFVFKKGNELLSYTDYSSIPVDLDYDHVIKFVPDCPPPPHNDEQHAEMERWNQRLQSYMSREKIK